MALLFHTFGKYILQLILFINFTSKLLIPLKLLIHIRSIELFILIIYIQILDGFIIKV
jgi:hypothetical protein